MKQLAIKAENISKQYRLGEVGTGTLSHDLNRLWYKLRGKEDPYLRIGEANDRATKGESNYVWSLRDINFEIEQGDAVGIIGRNGAGKSTLLKLLSKVTKPTTGNFKVNGRIASLLEVGTGFNPEMTGRENIYLNGAILGMRRHEITRKLDEIIDFSGVERYIDTPVKRYSSGMYVRLAFAVAAHLESEILIVDEVLAVGDAEFQKKCLGKMGDVSKGEGRTVLFVSHNIKSIQELCEKGLLFESGNLILADKVNQCLNLYSHKEQMLQYTISREVDLNKITIPLITSVVFENFVEDHKKFKFTVDFISPFAIKSPILGIVIKDYLGNPICGVNNRFSGNFGTSKPVSNGTFTILIDQLSLHSGSYTASFYLGDSLTDYSSCEDAIYFEILNSSIKLTQVPDSKFIGSLHLENVSWDLQ